MQLNQAPYRVIVEVRTALEPMISRHAAERISDESLAALATAVEQMRSQTDDRDSFLEADRRFHDVIAWSSGNVLFAYMVDSPVCGASLPVASMKPATTLLNSPGEVTGQLWPWCGATQSRPAGMPQASSHAAARARQSREPHTTSVLAVILGR